MRSAKRNNTITITMENDYVSFENNDLLNKNDMMYHI